MLKRNEEEKPDWDELEEELRLAREIRCSGRQRGKGMGTEEGSKRCEVGRTQENVNSEKTAPDHEGDFFFNKFLFLIISVMFQEILLVFLLVNINKLYIK